MSTVCLNNIDLADDEHVEGNVEKCRLNNCLSWLTQSDCLTNQKEGSDLNKIDILE